LNLLSIFHLFIKIFKLFIKNILLIEKILSKYYRNKFDEF
jgi:hypothetical protein